MKLSRIDIRETVRSFLYGARFGQVAWETLSVVSLVLSSIRHVRRDVHQADHRWIRAGFCNYGSPIAVRDKNARSILQGEHTLRRSHIILERRLRLLNDADFVAILYKNFVNAFPPRAIRPGSVYQNNIPDTTVFLVLTSEVLR